MLIINNSQLLNQYVFSYEALHNSLYVYQNDVAYCGLKGYLYTSSS